MSFYIDDEEYDIIEYRGREYIPEKALGSHPCILFYNVSELLKHYRVEINDEKYLRKEVLPLVMFQRANKNNLENLEKLADAAIDILSEW